MKVLMTRALAIVAVVGGTLIAWSAGTIIREELLPKREAVGVIRELPTTDGIMRWDPSAVHYWLVETVPGTLPTVKVLDDYSDAAECWKATFYEGPKDGPWRACLPLDEPAEEFLARFIAMEAYGQGKP